MLRWAMLTSLYSFHGVPSGCFYFLYGNYILYGNDILLLHIVCRRLCGVMCLDCWSRALFAHRLRPSF